MGDTQTMAATPRDRLFTQLQVSGGGILAATIVVPFVIAGWTPSWVPLAWGLTYVVQAVFFLSLVSWTGSGRIWCLWETITALLFSGICLSVLVWGLDHPSAIWIAAMLTLTYITFELTTLPYLPVANWYVGIAIASAALVSMTALVVHPFLGLGIVALIGSMLFVAISNRALRNDLDERLDDAERMLQHDPLTGLLNRRGLQAVLHKLTGETVTIAVFDANRFKHINDTQGHAVGDQALMTLAHHLRTTLGDRWQLARHGGDEFVAATVGDAMPNAETVAPLTMTLADRSGRLNLALSAGVASGLLADSADDLLSEAGSALRYAKREGRDLVRSEGALRDRFERSRALNAISRLGSPIVPVAQPIVSERGVVGCELLARCKMTDGSLLAPEQFMDMVVENGLLGRLDNEMLEHAVSLAARLQNEGKNLYVTANIAATHLLDVELPERVRHLLERHRVAPGRLMIEITESDRLGTDRLWEQCVRDLRALGIRLAIDDFGAGYSSVARLANLPITHLKLDRSVVKDASGPLGEIVQGVSRFCRESDISVIAEGIETVDDLVWLRKAGVETFQGYLFGYPMRTEDFLRDLENRTEVAGVLLSPVELEHR